MELACVISRDMIKQLYKQLEIPIFQPIISLIPRLQEQGFDVNLQILENEACDDYKNDN